MATAAVRRMPALSLPPPYTLVTLREAGDAFTHACGIADEAGAGTLVWVRRFDLIEFAVVLEPDIPLREARRAFYCGMNALADAVAAHCPPERDIAFAWPDTILFDGACIGGGRLGWPNGSDEHAVPDWLVFAGMLRTAWVGGEDPGLRPAATALEEEGFDLADGPALIETFARFLMRAFDRLEEPGFGPIADSYLARLAIRKAGEARRIDTNGDLLVAHLARTGTERLALGPALGEAAWLDPSTGMPKT